MKDELIALAMLRSSPRAQKLFLDLFGSKLVSLDFNPFAYLARSDALRDLSDYFRCRPEAGFSKLAETIRAEILEKRPSIVFTRKHMQSLADQRPTIRRLAGILHCDENRIYDELFDIPAILEYVYSLDPQTVRKWLLANLQDDANTPLGYTVVRYLLTGNLVRISDREWGRLLEDRLWLRSSALTALRGSHAEDGFSSTSDSKVLATIIDASQYSGPPEKVHLDALAILHIKRQINWIVKQMIDHAAELLDDALTTPKTVSILSDLKNHVDFYELKRPAVAWHRLLPLNAIQNPDTLRSLQSTFPGIAFSSTGAKGIPQVGTNLVARQENISAGGSSMQFWKAKKNEMQVIVSCRVAGQQEAMDVLICKNIVASEVQVLIPLLSSIKFSDDQSKLPLDIGQLLLLQGEPLDRRNQIRLQLSRLQPRIIRSIILLGLDIPASVPLIWDKSLNYEMPIPPLEDPQDTSFPMRREQIIQNIREIYQGLDFQLIDKWSS